MKRGRLRRASFGTLPGVLSSLAVGRSVVAFDVFDTLLRRRVEPDWVKDLAARRLARMMADASLPLPEGGGGGKGAGLNRPVPNRPGSDWRALRRALAEIESSLRRAAADRGLDHEFRLREMVPAWLARAGAPAAFAEALLDAELAMERAAVLPTPNIRAALDAAASRAGRLVWISDTYFADADVWSWLAQHRLDGYFAAGYASSTPLLTKRSGRLFRHVLEREGVPAVRLVMVGDNPEADAAPARAIGIDAVEVRDGRERARRVRVAVVARCAREHDFWLGQIAHDLACTAAPPQALRPVSWIDSEVAPLSRAVMKRSKTHRSGERCHQEASARQNLASARTPAADACPPGDVDDDHARLGMILGPAYLSFALHVLEEAVRRRLPRVFFLAREGAMFLRLYRRLARARGIDAPPAAYLAVSRASTYLPSIAQLTWPQVERIWRQYDRQSLRRLLQNLGLPEEPFAAHAARCGLADLDAPIERPRVNEAFRAFLADDRVQADFGPIRDGARSLLRDYLGRKGWFDHGRVGLVDVGWKGTMQENLFRATRGVPGSPAITGLYMGLGRNCLPGGPLSTREGFLADAREPGWQVRDAILHNGAVFEMFATARHGAVVGYQRTADGRIRPIIQSTDAERRHFTGPFAAVARGIEWYVAGFLAAGPLIDVSAQEWRPFVRDHLRRYVLYPTRREARALLEYTHVENFGVFGPASFTFDTPWRAILFGGRPWRLPRRLLRALRGSTWPHAALRRSGVPMANAIFDWIETRRAIRASRRPRRGAAAD